MRYQDHVRIIEPELAKYVLRRIGKHFDFFHDIFDRDQLRQRLHLLKHCSSIIDLGRRPGPSGPAGKPDPDNYPEHENNPQSEKGQALFKHASSLFAAPGLQSAKGALRIWI